MRETSQTAEATAVAPVDAALADLQQDIAALAGRLNTLEDRMARVLAPLPPSAGETVKAPVKPEPYRIAERISEVDVTVRRFTERVQSLLDRLEI